MKSPPSSRMPKYKLHYFDARGKAELSRLILHQAEVEFEDKRYSFEEWRKVKEDEKKFPLGKMPVLQIDEDITIPQSLAIARYLANEHGLAGSDNIEKAKCDGVVYNIQELFDYFYNWVYMVKEEDIKEQNEEHFYHVVLKQGLEEIKKMHLENNKGQGYFVGDQITMADLYLIVVADMWGDKHFEDLESLKNLLERVRASPNIKKYLENRPKTSF